MSASLRAVVQPPLAAIEGVVVSVVSTLLTAEPEGAEAGVVVLDPHPDATMAITITAMDDAHRHPCLVVLKALV
jgi:hypothetical protein